MTLNDSRKCHQTVLEEVLTSLSNLSSLVLPIPCFLSCCKTSPAASTFLMQLLHEHGTLLKFPSSASFAWKINFHVPKGSGLIYMVYHPVLLLPATMSSVFLQNTIIPRCLNLAFLRFSCVRE